MGFGHSRHGGAPSQNHHGGGGAWQGNPQGNTPKPKPPNTNPGPAPAPSRPPPTFVPPTGDPQQSPPPANPPQIDHTPSTADDTPGTTSTLTSSPPGTSPLALESVTRGMGASSASGSEKASVTDASFPAQTSPKDPSAGAIGAVSDPPTPSPTSSSIRGQGVTSASATMQSRPSTPPSSGTVSDPKSNNTGIIAGAVVAVVGILFVVVSVLIWVRRRRSRRFGIGLSGSRPWTAIEDSDALREKDVFDFPQATTTRGLTASSQRDPTNATVDHCNPTTPYGGTPATRSDTRSILTLSSSAGSEFTEDLNMDVEERRRVAIERVEGLIRALSVDGLGKDTRH